MWDGKKDTARKSSTMPSIRSRKGGADPLETFDTAIRNVSPLMEVRSRRVGGANYQVPARSAAAAPPCALVPLDHQCRTLQEGPPMAEKLADELLLAAKNEGDAIKKKDEMHRMADANKAFAHFAW
jgi:small subunit ribosomal protein S7